MMSQILQEVLPKVHAFESEAHSILARHEATISRLITIEDTYSKLTGLSLRQDELLREATKCVTLRLFKAAHVLAWAGFMDYLEDEIMSKHIANVRAARPNWSINSIEDLREAATEYELINVSYKINLFSKTEAKSFWGLLNRRNECAHPSNYSPTLNETLGFISELLNRISMLLRKSVPP